MFDPQLAGYWGTNDSTSAMDDLPRASFERTPDKVDGIKISLLDAQREIDMRRRLPKACRMYTGDDFNYAELIAGDDEGYSDALLGIFDAIAPAASAALTALARRRRATVPRDSRADRAVVAADLRRADARLQDRHRVPRLAQRASGSFPHGRRRGERALDPASLRVLPACGSGGAFPRPAACRRAHAQSSRGPRDSLIVRDLAADRALNTFRSTLRRSASKATSSQSSKPAKRHGIGCISPWRDQVGAVGLNRAAGRSAMAAYGFPAIAVAECSRRTPHMDREMIDDNRRAIDEAAALGRRCLVLVVGGLPQFSRPGHLLQ